MNIELFEGQSCLVHVKLPEAWEVYGGTPKGEFMAERESSDSVLVTVPAMEAEFTPLVPYELFARRILDGREWLVLSGQVHVRRRYSDAGGGVSAIEYFVEPQLVEDGISSSPQIIIGIPGPQGPKGEKGDPGEGGMTDEERDLLNGAAQRAGDNTFTAANTFTGEVDMSTAQVTPPEGWNVGELTPEAIQQVVPMAWVENTATPLKTSGSIAFGSGAKTVRNNVAIGYDAEARDLANVIGYGSFAGAAGQSFGNETSTGDRGVAVGHYAQSGGGSISIGAQSESDTCSVAIGDYSKARKNASITIGAQFDETVNGQNVTNECTTEGTGSITIGAGANTLNNGDTESSNSVTIGCKASNSGADSVVIGAQAENTGSGAVLIGGRNVGNGTTVLVGNDINANSYNSVISLGFGNRIGGSLVVAIGRGIQYIKQNAVSIGHGTSAGLASIAIGNSAASYYADNAIAIGAGAKVSDYGATVIRSTAEDGTYTQLYFSGANTPLANTYENGEAMMGYVVMQKGADGQFAPVAAGTQKLSVLFPNNSGFQPMTMSLDDEWEAPKVFHPSDLDLPTEETSEPEEYTPLPVYPIVEPADIFGDNGTLEQGDTENTSPATNS